MKDEFCFRTVIIWYKFCTLTYQLMLTRSPAVAMVGVVTDLEGHPRSMIFISSERAYVTSY